MLQFSGHVWLQLHQLKGIITVKLNCDRVRSTLMLTPLQKSHKPFLDAGTKISHIDLVMTEMYSIHFMQVKCFESCFIQLFAGRNAK